MTKKNKIYIRARKTLANACKRRGIVRSPQSTKSKDSMMPDPLGTLNRFEISAQFSDNSVNTSGTSQRVTSPSNTDYNKQEFIKVNFPNYTRYNHETQQPPKTDTSTSVKSNRKIADSYLQELWTS